MVEALPGRALVRDIAHQTDGAVGEAVGDVDDAAMGVVGPLIGAVRRWIDDIGQSHGWGDPFAAGLIAKPFVALPVVVVAIGDEGVAEGANGASGVVIAAQGPKGLVLVGVVPPQVNDAPGMEVMIDEVQDLIIPQAGIADDSLDMEVGVEGRQLEEQGGHGICFRLVGRAEVVQEDQTEATERVHPLDRQAAIAVNPFASLGRGGGVVSRLIGVGGGLVGAGVPDETGLRIAGGGIAAGGGTITALTPFRARRAGSRGGGGSGLVAGVGG